MIFIRLRVGSESCRLSAAYRGGSRVATKRLSVGRRGFLKTAVALVATAGAAPSGASAQDSPTAANPNWLALTRETALEPQLPIVDPHHHFWDTPERTAERYLLAQPVADADGHNVRQTVFIDHTQISELTDLARAFPDTTIICNHLGGPIGVGQFAGRRDEVFTAWKSAVAELARCPNVVAKVGGIRMVVNGYGWHQRKQPPTSDELLAANRDWYLHMIDRFTPARRRTQRNQRQACLQSVVLT